MLTMTLRLVESEQMDSDENEDREDRWHRLGEALKTSLSSLASMLRGASQIGRCQTCVHVGVWGKPNHTIRTVPLPGCQFFWCGFCLAGTSDTFLGMYSFKPY